MEKIYDAPIKEIEDMQKTVRKEIRNKIFGTVRKVRWKSNSSCDVCIVACIRHIIQNNDLTNLCDMNNQLIELSHEYYDRFFGENLVDDLLTLSVKDIIKQEAMKVWSEIGPKLGERKWRRSKKQ